MHVIPYLLVDQLPFSATHDQVRRHYGKPLRTETLNIGLHTLDYGQWVARFQHNGRLEEITKRAPCIHLHGQRVPFARLEAFVRRHDPAVFVRSDFVVSPRYGIAFVPGDSNWVTALAAHCIPTWRAMPAA